MLRGLRRGNRGPGPYQVPWQASWPEARSAKKSGDLIERVRFAGERSDAQRGRETLHTREQQGTAEAGLRRRPAFVPDAELARVEAEQLEIGRVDATPPPALDRNDRSPFLPHSRHQTAL
jgi:hypothetical protein